MKAQPVITSKNTVPMAISFGGLVIRRWGTIISHEEADIFVQKLAMVEKERPKVYQCLQMILLLYVEQV